MKNMKKGGEEKEEKGMEGKQKENRELTECVACNPMLFKYNIIPLLNLIFLESMQ
jgi:hypothetical protein